MQHKLNWRQAGVLLAVILAVTVYLLALGAGPEAGWGLVVASSLVVWMGILVISITSEKKRHHSFVSTLLISLLAPAFMLSFYGLVAGF